VRALRVLVCGGRNFHDFKLMAAELDRIHRSDGIALVISGAARGADTLAESWAALFGVGLVRFPADWARHGKAAGPIRNQQMLDEGKPDLVVAFPGGAGTADMVRRAKAAGVPVNEVRL